MPWTGRLCDRLGSGGCCGWAPLSALTLIGPALAGSFPALLGAAFVLGAGVGSLDVAMNAHAIAVERRYGRSIMSPLPRVLERGRGAGQRDHRDRAAPAGERPGVDHRWRGRVGAAARGAGAAAASERS
jgi:hypothetical protein